VVPPRCVWLNAAPAVTARITVCAPKQPCPGKDEYQECED
jgi:hypothetical protein